MLFRANEEPEITCARSIHNAEILSSWSAAGEIIETSWRSCEHIKPGDLSTALLRPFASSHAKYICSPIKRLRTSMSAPNSDQQNAETSQFSKNIEIPPIPKQTAGAVAGAAVGSIAGPIGAIVGGVAGALAGKAAKGRHVRLASARSVRKVVRKAKSAKGTAKPQLTTTSGNRSRKNAARSRSTVKRRSSNRSKMAKSRSKARTRRTSSSPRASHSRGGSRKKRH